MMDSASQRDFDGNMRTDGWASQLLLLRKDTWMAIILVI
jgi:hypothetical protein